MSNRIKISDLTALAQQLQASDYIPIVSGGTTYKYALFNYAVKNSGNETIAGIKTFSSSPLVPTPTADMQTSTKKYVDDAITGLNKGLANGIASLDSNGQVPSAQLPALVITETFVVASEVAMLALTAQQGDVAIRTDTNVNYILRESPASTLANWEQLRVALDPNIPTVNEKAALAGTSGTPSASNTYTTKATSDPLVALNNYDPLFTYNITDKAQTFYLGIPYKSLDANNLGNTPDTSPTKWEVTGGGSGTGGQAGYGFTGGQIEGNVVGYNPYADTAQAIPVDGTGGAADVTFTASAILPLVGTGSGLLTKDAVNRQGQGVSKDFTIDRGLTSAPAQFRFIYETSANFAYGDVGFYIYDVTTGIILTPNNILLPNTFGVPQEFISNFYPTKDVTAYRFILHIASTSALAYTVKLDDITLGAKETIVAPAISDWQSYTPTFQGFGTPTAIDFKWRRNGSNLDLKGKFTVGVLSEVEARVSLPNQYTSRADVPAIEMVGMGEPNTGATANYVGLTVLSEASKDYVCFGAESTTFGGLSKRNPPLLVAVGATISFTCSIPCAQFSVNTSFIGMNEPMYLSNSESVVNTNGVVAKTYNGIDGSPILANTSATYYDITLPRALLPNERLELEVRSIITGNWLPARNASFTVSGISYGIGLLTVMGYVCGVGLQNITVGVARVFFGALASINDGVGNILWSSAIASANYGFDRWRVRIGQAGLAEAPNYNDVMKATNGYQKLPSGLIMQWGTTVSIPSGIQVTSVPLPMNFPTACLNASATQTVSWNGVEANPCVSAKSTSTITISTIHGTAQPLMWQAIGY